MAILREYLPALYYLLIDRFELGIWSLRCLIEGGYLVECLRRIPSPNIECMVM